MPENDPDKSKEENDSERNADREEEAKRNVSDLNDPGDPEAEDVGIPGGAGSGGEYTDGGSGGVEREDDEEDLDRDKDRKR